MGGEHLTDRLGGGVVISGWKSEEKVWEKTGRSEKGDGGKDSATNNNTNQERDWVMLIFTLSGAYR